VGVTDGAINVQFAQNESLDAAARASATNALSHKSSSVSLKTHTVEGAAFVEKYLHPPTPRPACYAGIPDRNATPGVDYEWRMQDELDVTQANGVLGTANGLLVFSPPSFYRKRFCFAVDGNVAVQIPVLNDINRNVNAVSWNANNEAFRMCYLSDTYEQDASALNNSGMVYGAQFRPNVTSFAASSFELAQRFGKHVGYDKMTQIVDEHLAKRVSSTSPALHVQVINLGVIPLSGGDVLMRSPKSSTWRSTIGGYLPHKFSEPVQEYKSVARSYASQPVPPFTSPVTTTSPNSTYLCFYESYIPVTDTWTLTPFRDVITPSSTAQDLAPWYEMTWSVFLYDFSANSLTGITSAAPIVHKKIVGIESQPPFGSINQALMRDNPMLDQLALDIVSTHDTICRDMLPAAANAGGFISAVAKWAPSVLSTLGSVFGVLRKPKASDESVNSRVGRFDEVMDKLLNSPLAEKVSKKVDKAQAKSKAAKAAKALASQ